MMSTPKPLHDTSADRSTKVVIDMESGQRFIIRCEAAIPLPNQTVEEVAQ